MAAAMAASLAGSRRMVGLDGDAIGGGAFGSGVFTTVPAVGAEGGAGAADAAGAADNPDATTRHGTTRHIARRNHTPTTRRGKLTDTPPWRPQEQVLLDQPVSEKAAAPGAPVGGRLPSG